MRKNKPNRSSRTIMPKNEISSNTPDRLALVPAFFVPSNRGRSGNFDKKSKNKQKRY